jgi:hypothetical protein
MCLSTRPTFKWHFVLGLPSGTLEIFKIVAIKAKACKGVGQEGSPETTSHILGNVGECEGMNLHTPK